MDRSKVAVFELSTYAAVVVMIVEGKVSSTTEKGRIRKEDRVSWGNSGQEVVRVNLTRNQDSSKEGIKDLEDQRVDKESRGSQQQNTNQQRQQRPPLPDCKTCGKKHSGVCNKANIVCFICNQKGHYANEFKSQRPPILCNRCGKLGHIAKNCRTGMPTTTINNLLRITAPN